MRQIIQRTTLAVGTVTTVLFLPFTLGYSFGQDPGVGFEKADHVINRATQDVVQEPGRLGTICEGFDSLDPALGLPLVDALSKQEAPDSRLVAFQELDRDEVRLDGWHALLTGIDLARSEIRLRVTPLIATTASASTTVLATHEEIYRFQDGSLTLLDAKPSGVMALIHD